jgi:hypothetical protein
VSVDGSPYFGRGLKADIMRENIRRQRVEDPVKHQLITSNLGHIFRTLHGDLLFVCVHINIFLR